MTRPVSDQIADFVAAESGELLRLAWMLTGDAGRAEDLLQTALAKTWPHWQRVAASGTPERYVRRVMINQATAWGRRRWRHEVPTLVLPETAMSSETSAVDERDALRRALARLPARQRAAVVLRYYEGLSEQETALLLECSVGTVKSQASRGLEKLRSELPTATQEPA